MSSWITLSVNNHTGLYPQLPTVTTSQNLVSHAGLSTLTGLLNVLGFRQLAEDRLSQFAPTIATHWPGKMISDLVLMLAAGGEHVTDTDQLRERTIGDGKLLPKSWTDKFQSNFWGAARCDQAAFQV